MPRKHAWQSGYLMAEAAPEPAQPAPKSRRTGRNEGGAEIARPRAKPSGPLEKEVERSCMKLYRLFGGALWHLSQPRPTKQSAGLPDLLVFVEDVDGAMRCAAHEVKRVGGVQSPAQREFQAFWESAGGTYLLGGLDVAGHWLSEIGRLQEVAP